MTSVFCLMSACLWLTTAQANELLAPPTTLPGLSYDIPLLSGPHDPSISTPESLLGFPVGQRTATPEQIVRAIQVWTEESDRAELVEYARSHEGRPLYYVVISSPENLARIDEIKTDLTALADASGTSEAQASAIIDRLPSVAWMAYSIHGNESSGADAALATVYHLTASTDSAISTMLDQQIVLIDPSMNPDGRARFVKELEQMRGTAPNIDDQSMLHNGSWPYGRTNHYLFDLNRDFMYLVHPETRGRVAAINQWRPQLMIDGHEMGSQDTYLFAPAREPINANIASTVRAWNETFGNDQAAAFDSMGWTYYTGEWFENLYGGYSSYAEYRGTVHILYEQANVDEDGIKRPDGTILSYREAVHHQLLSTLTNLKTLAAHSKDMYQQYAADRRAMLASSSPYANISYAILPSDNHGRMNDLVEILQLQDIEVYQTTRELTVSDATDHLGKTSRTTLPEGTVVVPNRQAEARLISAMLEFDAPIKDDVLIKERQAALRDGSSIMYDVTAWNLTMMYGLPALRIGSELTANLEPYTPKTAQISVGNDATLGWVVNGADDRSLGFAARLMEQGLQVRVIDKAAEFDGNTYSRGSVMVSRRDNRLRDDLAALVQAEARHQGISLSAVNQGLGQGELPDIGGRHFRLLTRPNVALLSHGMINPYDFGTIWHSLDTHLGIRHSHLDSTFAASADLRRYNVLIVPDRWGGNLDGKEIAALKRWVEEGNTLIAIDGSVPGLLDPEKGLSEVRTLEGSFDDLAGFDLALQREWQALSESPVDLEMTRRHQVPISVTYPQTEGLQTDEDTLKQTNQWQRLFAPSGAFIAGRTDQKHWLTFGVDETMPILIARNPVLMSGSQSRAVVRLGSYEPMSDSAWDKQQKDLDDEAYRVGWSTLPEQQALRMRMSGLLWPEASQRLANSAWLTQEGLGKGQVILFASEPNFRGAARGMNRLLLNAIVYGPGLGTEPEIEL